ncbi:hypothetical protein RB196_18845 [Streptomyces sp. PmtA]|uniref:hypothetical protein n=1 Tax=Streptomyces sp. PmtA TaxID=3074275 RepID=UPI0030158841
MQWRADAHLAGASVVIAGSLLMGCSGGSSDARPLPERTTVTAVSRAPDAKHAEALDAYRAMWQDLAIASETSDAGSPLLDDHAKGGALELMKYGLREAKREKVVSKGRPLVDPRVVSGTSQEVTVQDCVDGTDWLQYKLDGELKNDVPGSHTKADATVRRDGKTWKVSKLYLHEAGSC